MIAKLKIIGCWLLLFCPLYGDFLTLNDLREYAKAYPECPKKDNEDWTDPEFMTFYQKGLKRSFWECIVGNVSWSEGQFADLLQNVTASRKEKKAFADDMQTLEVREGDRIYIFGDGHGAFHSFVRDFDELKRKGEIDDNLIIRSKNVFFIFVGDLVSRSPYSLETLHHVLLLMYKNPRNVFYLRGKHESNKYWESFSMRRALKTRLQHMMDSIFAEVPFVKEINEFFATLPRMLLINHKASGEKACCSHSVISKNLLEDTSVVLALNGEQRIGVVRETKGLSFVGHVRHMSQWAMMSCPVGVYQKFFNFYYDSFVEFSIGPSISESVLTLINRDIRKKGGFTQSSYNPIFGYRLKGKKNVVKDKKIVNVGCTTSLSGITGPLGREVVSGLEAAFYEFNKEDNEVLIKLVTLDDGYVPRLARDNVETFLDRYGIDIILAPIGTPTLSFYLDLVKAGKLAVLFPYTGAVQFRKPDSKNIVHFRASYTQEMQRSVRYLVKRGVKKFAFFYQDDAYGAPIATAAREELKRHGIEKWLDLPHLRTQTNFADHVKKMHTFMPDAVGFFSSHFPSIEFISKAGTGYFLNKMLFGNSFLHSDAFRNFLDNRGITFLFSSVVPDKTAQIDLVKQHEKAVVDLGKFASNNSFEGYIAGLLFVEAAKNVAYPIKKEAIVSYFERMKDYDLKGLKLSFDPKSRQLFQSVGLSSTRGLVCESQSHDLKEQQ